MESDSISPDEHDPSHLRRERDLYVRLLGLDGTEQIEPFLDEALQLIIEITGARRGYLELRDERGAGDEALFWMARGCSDAEVEETREVISQGVIAATIAAGETIRTASALVDPRFKERGSVRRNRIEAVLCAPIGTSPPIGVLYLQDRQTPGPFSDGDRTAAEIFARHVAVLADRLLAQRRRREEDDPTRPFRRRLAAEGLIGRSRALADVLREVTLAADNDVSVLLTGPNGTGKTQIARILHDSSPRAKGPFVELNCATLTESLFESELFGAVRGAFTGATRDVDGKVAAAAGGTLFLDEMGEIPLTAQAKLLQFLQSKTYYPVGRSVAQRADIRVIAATNIDLEAAVAQRAFREDLYYRLEEMPIRVPSLAERREDIADLVRYFFEQALESEKGARLAISPGALRAAEAAEWPGNIRQLANRVRRGVRTARHEGAAQMEREHLFPGSPSSQPAELSFQEATRRFQTDLLRQTLERTSWNIMETARVLDITRSHVYNLIKAFGLERKRGRPNGGDEAPAH